MAHGSGSHPVGVDGIHAPAGLHASNDKRRGQLGDAGDGLEAQEHGGPQAAARCRVGVAKAFAGSVQISPALMPSFTAISWA